MLVMNGCLRRLMVSLVLLLSAASLQALEPEVEALPQPDDEAIVQMEQAMAIRDDRALNGILERFRKDLPADFWSSGERLPRLVAALEDLATDGLAPSDYGVQQLRQWPPREREQLATKAYLLALLHLYRGKVDPVALDAQWNLAGKPAFDRLLEQARAAAEKGEPGTAFNFARPVRPEYNLLRTALARYRGIALEGGWPTLPAGKSLKPGQTDARVGILRQRLQVAGLASHEPTATPSFFDDDLALAVMRFQREAYLVPDGVVGPSTLSSLNVPVADRIDQLRANLERMRWVHDPGIGPMVVVDIAGFRIVYLNEGRAVWTSRVQVGRAYRSTPVFRSQVTHLTLNPTWTVPPTIMANDVLPGMRKDQGYLRKHHLKVYDRSGRTISPEAVNWWNPGDIVLRQDAGPENALGELAIRFPNPYSVYLHDTPHKTLFESSQRAFSSGCIRVENAHELAVLLLNDAQAWSREGLQAAIAEGKTRQVNLVTPVPILLAYWTVDVARDGYVSFKADIYERDRALVTLLDRRVSL